MVHLSADKTHSRSALYRATATMIVSRPQHIMFRRCESFSGEDLLLQLLLPSRTSCWEAGEVVDLIRSMGTEPIPTPTVTGLLPRTSQSLAQLESCMASDKCIL